LEVTRHPDFAVKLRSARLRSGKSQERIAAEVGTSRRHWIRWERGDHLPSSEFMAKIGEATGQPEAFAEFTVVVDDADEESDPVADLMAALRRVVREELAVKA
jgi:transcriptional regulator with XRE-family HTH domain